MITFLGDIVSIKSDRIKSMLLDGCSYRDIALETGASKSTIHYHSQRLGNPLKKDYGPQTDLARQMISSGMKNYEIREATMLSISTICKIRREEGMPSECKRIDWIQVQALHDSGKSRLECIQELDISAGAWSAAVTKGLIVSTRQGSNLDDILVENSNSDRGHLKRRLIREGILAEECVGCGTGPEWNGKPLTLALDHINGVNNDNRLENLRLLCPNCHSQTDTFAGRNVKRQETPTKLRRVR